jgi:hypothetical protein
MTPLTALAPAFVPVRTRVVLPAAPPLTLPPMINTLELLAALLLKL